MANNDKVGAQTADTETGTDDSLTGGDDAGLTNEGAASDALLIGGENERPLTQEEGGFTGDAGTDALLEGGEGEGGDEGGLVDDAAEFTGEVIRAVNPKIAELIEGVNAALIEHLKNGGGGGPLIAALTAFANGLVPHVKGLQDKN